VASHLIVWAVGHRKHVIAVESARELKDDARVDLGPVDCCGGALRRVALVDHQLVGASPATHYRAWPRIEGLGHPVACSQLHAPVLRSLLKVSPPTTGRSFSDGLKEVPAKVAAGPLRGAGTGEPKPCHD